MAPAVDQPPNTASSKSSCSSPEEISFFVLRSPFLVLRSSFVPLNEERRTENEKRRTGFPRRMPSSQKGLALSLTLAYGSSPGACVGREVPWRAQRWLVWSWWACWHWRE